MENRGFDNYGSHLAVFEKIFSTFDIKSILEFGLGRYSTKYFTDHCQFVVSVEQENREWYDKITDEIDAVNWCHVFQFNPEAVFKYFDDKDVKFDLVFSDGAAQTRCLVANMAMELNVPVVVLHDAEKIWYYKWDLLNIPTNYSRFDFRCKKMPQKVTSVIVNNNAELVDRWIVPGHERIIQAYSSPYQPVIQFVYPGDSKTSVKPAKAVSSRQSILIPSN